MKTFGKTSALALVAAAALGAAALPAAAQSWRGYDRGYDNGYAHGYGDDGRLPTSYVDGLDWKISNAAREGRISWDEARNLRAQLRSVQPLAFRV